MSEDIVLTDWNTRVTGRAKVIEAMDDLFALNNTIDVAPISFFSNSDYSYAVLILITINGGKGIEVIDIINFNIDGKIESVNAFRIENI